MSEYWISTAKRYCDACKCYIGDNKASIQNHEQGKRHKENVARRVEAIAKRGAEDYAKRSAYENDMAKIEAAALAAVAKDGITLGEQDRKQYKEILSRQEEGPHKSYYDAAVAAASSGNANDKLEATSTHGAAHHLEKIKTPDETKGVAGGWVTIAVRDIPKESDTFLEEEKPVEVNDIPLPPPEKRKRFSEKIVTLSELDDDSCSVPTGTDGTTKIGFGFKRKVHRGNMRQRNTDD